MPAKSIAVFASGGGTNFQAIADAIETGQINGRIHVVITDNPDAGVIQRAESMGIESVVIRPQSFQSQDDYISKLVAILEYIDLIVLAGYMKLIPAEITRQFQHRMVNIHPALIPAFCGKGFYGMRVHRAVIDAGVKISGVTVHFVDEVYDHGPIIAQRTVPVTQDETPETLADKIHKIEHSLYPEVISLICADRVRVDGNRVIIE